jgi:hypothetical protein
MKWFGPAWGAPVNATCDQTAVPVGETCGRCGVAFVADDVGFVLPALLAHDEVGTVAYHRRCLAEMIGIRER